MYKRIKKRENLCKGLMFFVFLCFCCLVTAQENSSLSNGTLNLQWKKTEGGYQLVEVTVKDHLQKISLDHLSGAYTILYSAQKPSNKPLLTEVTEKTALFPDSSYGHIFNRWKASLGAVPLNLAGKAIEFMPSNAVQKGEGEVIFSKEARQASVTAVWQLHPIYKNDILVEISITAKEDGFYAIASPTLGTILQSEIAWGMIPGYFQSNTIEPDLVLSYGYGQGIPNRPVVYRERTATTLVSLITNKQGVSMAVIAEPDQGRDPWKSNKNTQKSWQVGLSVMNRKGEYTPTLYHPVLGEENSYLKKGEIRTFKFRYTLQATDWYTVYKHAVNDVYRFSDVLKLKDTKESLTSRILAMSDYLKDDSISMWNVQNYRGLKIGAQDYLSSVYDKDDDAMKNSDYGAMWMLAKIMNDSILNNNRLPYARNFKIAQQNDKPGFFNGAALGQYYLWKSKRFVEEWGNYVEPIGLTYYVMLDIGNILLFNPQDSILREKLRMGAERLMKWQHDDGHWEVGYDKDTAEPMFTDLKDFRPTFYGLLVAYRILRDEKYLRAAEKGADWFIKNAVNEGKFLGVCGDFRFVPDFATGQSVQALLDLYDINKNVTYKNAAIEASKIYTTSVFTHPIPDRSIKTVKGVKRQDWEISQVGSRVEQGGLLGSANGNGPILLASHAGMFVRLFQLTNDSIYINMARAATWGQDAFVNPSTHVASYYWDKMNAGVGRYPHHAWWQVGWITDYLLSEIELRSQSEIHFPRGFITPKVGPHQSYAFVSGKVFGKSADLYLPPGLLSVDNHHIDYMTALNAGDKELYLLFLNNSLEEQTAIIKLDDTKIIHNKIVRVDKAILLDGNGKKKRKMSAKDFEIAVPPAGLKVVKITYR